MFSGTSIAANFARNVQKSVVYHLFVCRLRYIFVDNFNLLFLFLNFQFCCFFALAVLCCIGKVLLIKCCKFFLKSTVRKLTKPKTETQKPKAT